MQKNVSKNKSRRFSRQFGQCSLTVSRILRVYVSKHAVASLGRIRMQSKRVEPLACLDQTAINNFFDRYKPEWSLRCIDDLHMNSDGVNPDPDVGPICSICFVLYELHNNHLEVCGFMSARLYQEPGPYETCWWGENVLIHPAGESGFRFMIRLVMNYIVSIQTPCLYLQVDPSNQTCLGAIR